jgi:hypothetical protein
VIPKCPCCPIEPGVVCPALPTVCQRVCDPGVAALFVARYQAGLVARADPSGVTPLADAMKWIRLIGRCQYRSTEGCGCSGARCALSARIVGPHDCVECVKTYGES